jgi:SAM-dependent methyltransferase
VSFTERFSERAAAYVTGRPSYPEAAFDLLLDGLGEPQDVLVADLGAGTGIASRLLAARGARVLAIEPNAAMREAAAPDERVEWIAASAEWTGLAEASVDLVTAFQAFHWFDARKALDEIVRILRPGGRAAVVYNERDERDPFTAGYGEIVRRFQTDQTERKRADGVETFSAFPIWHGGPRRDEIPHEQPLDLEGVLARARSTSYLPKDGPPAAALATALRELFAQQVRDGRVTMKLVTIVVAGDVGADGG